MCYSITDVDDLHALASTVRDLTGITERSVLIRRIGEAVGTLTGFDRTAIALVDPEFALTIAHTVGLSPQVMNTRIEFGAGLGGTAVATKTSHLAEKLVAVDTNTLDLIGIGEPGSWPADKPFEDFIRDEFYCAAAQPVTYGGLVIAVIYAGHHEPIGHTHSPLAMLSEFAAFAAPLLVSSIRASELEALAKAEERQRIVQHLHETSLQHMFNITLTSKALLNSELSSAAAGRVAAIEAEAASASMSLRDTFSAALPVTRNLVIAVHQMVEAFMVRSGVYAQLVTLGSARPVPIDVERVVLSATKEMLHNAEKHSQASNVAVCLNFGAEELRLTIQDDGIGLPAGFQPPTTPATCPGIGLASVGQSVTVLGGNVDWSGNDDGGTAVSVSIPCAA